MILRHGCSLNCNSRIVIAAATRRRLLGIPSTPDDMTRFLSRLAVAAALASTLSACSEAPPRAPVGAGADWANYLGHPSSNQYSLLDQIDTENVHLLEMAWAYDTGEVSEYQSNNLIVDGVLYTATPNRKMTALNAATGEHLWTFNSDEINPYGGGMHQGGGRQRGFIYWEDGENGRIFTTKGPWLYSLDAETGEPVPSFGEGGWLHIGDRIDWEGRPNVGLNSGGYVYEGMLIFGVRVAENVPGAVIALDARTGERVWIFHTLPRPGEFGSETWPEGYLEYTGGASDWSGIAMDMERGIVYSSTETAGPDFYGGDRYGRICSPTPLLRWTRAPASACGTSSSSITTCGIWTTRPRPRC